MSVVTRDFYITLTESDFKFSRNLTPQLILDETKTWYMALTDYTLVNAPHVVFEKNETLFEAYYTDKIRGRMKITHRARTPLTFASRNDVTTYIENETGKDFIFKYNKNNNTLSIQNKSSTVNHCGLLCIEQYIVFYPKLASLLGFLPFTYYGNKTKMAPFTFNIYGGFNNIYLYCPLIANSYIGDILSPLLKIISLNRNRYIDYKEFINPTYFKIKHNIISDLQILIKDEFGSDIVKNPNAPTILNLTLHISTTTL